MFISWSLMCRREKIKEPDFGMVQIRLTNQKDVPTNLTGVIIEFATTLQHLERKWAQEEMISPERNGRK